MTKTSKLLVPEVKVGMTVKGNLIGGTHEIAAIRTRPNVLRNTSTEYSFYDVDGREVFIGRISAKATIVIA